MAKVKPQVKELAFSARFEQGYRFLDRCGEALVRLENTLADGWIPTEQAPTGGVMRNYALGLTTKFSSEVVSVQQNEFISFDVFRDQCSKIFEIVTRLFDVPNIISPAMQTTIQVGTESVYAAEQYISTLDFARPSDQSRLLLGNRQEAFSYVIVGEADTPWNNTIIKLRSRLSVRSIKQTKQPDYDARLMQRMSLLSLKHQEAIKGALELRRAHVAEVRDSVEIALEKTLESILDAKRFSIGLFLNDAWHSSTQLLHALPDPI